MRHLVASLAFAFAAPAAALASAPASPVPSPSPAVAAAPAASGVPAAIAVPASGGASPVQIDLCRLGYTGGGFGLFALAKSTGGLEVKFTNESERSATVVRFAVNLDGQTASIRDVGTFGPGVTVVHTFKDFAGTFQFVFSRQPQPKCHVTFVKFADGTLWSAPDDVPVPDPSGSPSPAPAAAAAAPAQR